MASSSQKLTWDDKFKEARIHKDAGNAHYKAGVYKAAIGQYHRALLYLKGIDSLNKSGMQFLDLMSAEDKSRAAVPPEAEADIAKMKMDCYNNLAACILHAADPTYKKIVAYCDNVLEIQNINVKALYRKGVALYHLKQPEEALKVLQAAQALPQGQTDTSIKKYLQMCEQKIKAQDETMRDMYRSMLGTRLQDPEPMQLNEEGSAESAQNDIQADKEEAMT